MELLFQKLSLEETPIEKADINISDINKRIKSEICFETINSLSDENLLEEYKLCKSTLKEIDKLEKILSKNEVKKDKINDIIKDYILELINPGTKGVIRGNKFNKIVKDKILLMEFIKNEAYEVEFEKKSSFYETSEIPDWYIFNKKTKKILIGMNQLDLWGGGQQINRGSKYLIDFQNTEKVKLICVVCNEIEFKSNKSKSYKLFERGFDKNTLCYVKNLSNIIESFFK